MKRAPRPCPSLRAPPAPPTRQGAPPDGRDARRRRAAQAAAVRRPSARRPACAGRSGEGGGRTARPPRAARRAAPLGQTPSGGGREQRRAPRAERATPPLTTPSTRTASNWATSTRRGGGGAERMRGARARVRAPFGTTPARLRVAHLQARAGCLHAPAPRSSVTFLPRVHRHAPHPRCRGGGLEPAATSSEHCAAGCCQVDGPFDPLEGGTEK